jgi:long-chain acyl-CoA synthetase
MTGYWDRPKETAEVLAPDGWLRTGDAARSDKDGYIWIVGRVADSFLCQGQVVHPGDVERVLLGHPAVTEAGVAAVPGAGGEQVLTALVVVVPGAEVTAAELTEWCRERLASHQVPARVVFVGTLPRNSVGKLIRTDLQEMARESG